MQYCRVLVTYGVFRFFKKKQAKVDKKAYFEVAALCVVPFWSLYHRDLTQNLVLGILDHYVWCSFVNQLFALRLLGARFGSRCVFRLCVPASFLFRHGCPFVPLVERRVFRV